ncbi:uncharacterized protein AB675_9945 [Cyphellophora attinorum]|uniref:DUF1996 domain-containing protein n=1 Tax=Cyphellophora attinorum TaxID=1664694 RepID=A0A0N1H443_9EURO|nr:uncharacterized protein AB675_9945 [Phialophora attinorum]KPI35362.1 hypothetical protein AB675_9945 [Phialophora attinorum]
MSYDDTQAADCTTCMVTKDKSNYWVASMYHNDGSNLTPVPQHGSASIYYMNNPTLLGPGETMETLPTGLRMLAGFGDKRAEGPTMEDEAIRYKCLDYSKDPTQDIKGFPTYPCKDGIRAQVTFPSCWNGKDLDSDDHKSHMAYPSAGPDYGGSCPSSHPHHVVTVKMEVIFATNNFAWGADGKNPFIWSNGDNTGWGLHADMIMGWDADVLKAAYLDPGTCKLTNWVNEDATAIVNKLPGCNSIGAVVKAQCQDGVTLKGEWSSFGGNFVNNTVDAVANAVAGAAPSAAPAQFYDKPSDAAAPPSPAAGNPHVKTETVWVTTTEIVHGVAPATPAPAAGAWGDAAKRDEHVHRHAHAHGRRWAF